jgi:hypothetical protein
MPGPPLNYVIEPMTLGNMRANGVRSLAVSCPGQKPDRTRCARARSPSWTVDAPCLARCRNYDEQAATVGDHSPGCIEQDPRMFTCRQSCNDRTTQIS